MLEVGKQGLVVGDEICWVGLVFLHEVLGLLLSDSQHVDVRVHSVLLLQ